MKRKRGDKYTLGEGKLESRVLQVLVSGQSFVITLTSTEIQCSDG